MAVRLEDIAKKLDMSTATVSRSLRNDQMINPATRARVTETARRMGYIARGRPARNRGASADIEGSQQAQGAAVGLLLRPSSTAEEARNDVNLMKMMAGVLAVADANRVIVQIHTIENAVPGSTGEDATGVPAMIREGACQAVIVRGEHVERDLEFLIRRMPVVSMGRIYRNFPMDAAVADNSEGVRALVTHLAGLGHHALGWVGAQYSTSFLESREVGFMHGCRGNNLPLDRQRFFGAEIFEGHEIHHRDALLSAVDAGVTAFVCGNDAIAYRVIQVLQDAGRRVPEDVSVTGFDAWQSPVHSMRVTSVDPHFHDIGAAAARLALQRISQPAAQPCIVSVRCEIVVGDTTGPVPDGR